MTIIDSVETLEQLYTSVYPIEDSIWLVRNTGNKYRFKNNKWHLIDVKKDDLELESDWRRDYQKWVDGGRR